MAASTTRRNGNRSAEYRVFHDKLKDLARQCEFIVTSLANELFSRGLISDLELGNALNNNQSPYHRVTELLRSILRRIENDSSCFTTLVLSLSASDRHDLADELEEMRLQYCQAQASAGSLPQVRSRSTLNCQTEDKTSASPINPSSLVGTHSKGPIHLEQPSTQSPASPRHETTNKSSRWIYFFAAGLVLVSAVAYSLLYYRRSAEQMEKMKNMLSDVTVNSKPTLAQMELLEVKGHEIRTIQAVTTECETLSRFLGLEDDLVNNIWDRNEQFTSESRCKKAIGKWLKGKGKKPLWGTFIKAVRDLKLNELADELESVLKETPKND